MKKRTRDLKKHYRNVKYRIRSFQLDLSKDSWYSLWHTHLDWHGITNNSEKHRKKHIIYYLDLLEKTEMITKHNDKKFQTWIFFDSKEGMYDAIYFHTENPNNEFPYKISNIQWNIELPNMFQGLLDLSKYSFGRIDYNSNNKYSYFIQKKGLGESI